MSDENKENEVEAPVEASREPEQPVESPAVEEIKPIEIPAQEIPITPEKVEIEHVGTSKTIEKSGDRVTITEIMPTPHSETVTPQMAGNEVLTQKRQENLIKANLKRQNKKSKNLDKILLFFAKNSKVTKSEIEKLLHVSDATAIRYLDELENIGKIKQIGNTGKYTYYQKI